MLAKVLAVLAIALAPAGCSETIDLSSGGGENTCVPGGPQCNDCIDNDSDGVIDGFDPECTGARDDDEGSFATNIPGDNQNGTTLDCFYDGNSGAGNDGCDLHICCVLDLMGAPCPDELRPRDFDPDQCEPSDQCVQVCSPLVPAGCDCFGCCTVCVGAECHDVLISPEYSPECDSDNVGDPSACARCTKSTCGSSCDPEQCILCPGQTSSDLPAGCEQTCPAGAATCGTQSPCPADEFCSNGCCIATPQ